MTVLRSSDEISFAGIRPGEKLFDDACALRVGDDFERPGFGNEADLAKFFGRELEAAYAAFIGGAEAVDGLDAGQEAVSVDLQRQCRDSRIGRP